MAQQHRRPTSGRNLDAYRIALQLVAQLSPLIPRIARYDKDIAGQLKRALPKIPQNIAEAMRRLGNDRSHLLTVALGSTDEVRTVVDITAGALILTAAEARAADQLADRVCAMTYRLHQRC